MKSLILATFLCLFSIIATAQSTLSIETQAYPAGVIPGLRYEYWVSEQVHLFVRGALNFTDRRDWGVQDNEDGSGAGLGVGAEFKDSRFDNLSFNVRADLWFMEIDWETNILCERGSASCGRGQLIKEVIPGQSDVTVLQPTIGFGYTLPNNGRFLIKPTLNIGYEINIKTNGEAVGDGAILLGGIQIGYVF